MRLLAAAAVILALVGCSGGTDDAAPTTTTERPSTTTTLATTTTTVDLTSRPAPPTSAEDAASMIEAAEVVLHDPGVADTDPRVARAGHIEQVAMRALADHPDWDAAVAKRLSAAYRQAAVDDAAAGRDLRSLVRTPKPNLPAWTIVEPAPADELRRY